MATKKPTYSDDTAEDPGPAPTTGTDPVSPPVEPGPKVETMDDLGIKPTDPYPTSGG